jgi:hypothetical protein
VLGWEREEKDVQLLRNSFSVDLCTGGNCAPCEADQAMDGTDWAGLGAHVRIVGWPDNCGSARNLGFLSISITDVFIMKFRRRRQRCHQAGGLKERTPRSLGPERGSLGLGAQR